jgi:hypothetical protein
MVWSGGVIFEIGIGTSKNQSYYVNFSKIQPFCQYLILILVGAYGIMGASIFMADGTPN